MPKTTIRKEQGGVPSAGNTGQVLTKNSNTNYDDDWADPTGGSGSGGTAPSYFDDFVMWVGNSDSGPADYENVVSGNFARGSNANMSFSSESDHPGIVNFTAPASLEGFRVIQDDSGGSRLLNFQDGFNIEMLARNEFSGINWQVSYSLDGGGGNEITVHFDDDGNIKYNIGGGDVDTGLTVPTSLTWFKVNFDYNGTTLSISVDGVVIYTGAASLSGNYSITWGLNEDTQLSTASLDYVKTTIPGRTFGSGGSEKKVGVGELSDINWFNIQYPFDTDIEYSIWGYSNIAQTSQAFMGFNSQGFIYAGDQGDGNYQYLLPDFDSSDGGLHFDTTKLVIFQCAIVTALADTDLNLGGVGFNLWDSRDATLEQGSSSNVVIAFVRADSDGQWYTHVSDGSGMTENAITLTDETKYVLRVEYDPGNATPQARFYVNGTLIDTITTNLPTDKTEIIGWSGGNGNGSSDTAIKRITCPSFAVEI